MPCFRVVWCQLSNASTTATGPEERLPLVHTSSCHSAVASQQRAAQNMTNYTDLSWFHLCRFLDFLIVQGGVICMMMLFMSTLRVPHQSAPLPTVPEWRKSNVLVHVTECSHHSNKRNYKDSLVWVCPESLSWQTLQTTQCGEPGHFIPRKSNCFDFTHSWAAFTLRNGAPYPVLTGWARQLAASCHSKHPRVLLFITLSFNITSNSE